MRTLVETYKGVKIYKEGTRFVANVCGDVMYESNLHDMRMNINECEEND